MTNKNDIVLKEINKEYRESGLELFRILTMLQIIAHHYVVNSGLMAVIFADSIKC